MRRRIIEINQELCNGCGACAIACHEGAIQMIDGKAKLIRDDYCDGLGDCLPTCPTNAITFVEREAAEFNPEALKKHQEKLQLQQTGCPSSNSRTIATTLKPEVMNDVFVTSQLKQWPVQIQLVPINAPYFENAEIVIAADCSAYAYANFHSTFMKNKITLIGCPKLDSIDYSEKLTAILRQNSIKSITVVRNEVPCCGGLEYAVKTALQNSQKMIPWQVKIISIEGSILE